ncbi:chitobiosyldiphosphodolichol beta-mannosyltransferase [Diutina catenulata]
MMEAVPMVEWVWDRVWYFIAFYCSLPIIVYYILPFLSSPRRLRSRPTVSIMVLGDVGHSPRMCYHAHSFAQLGYFVNLCGYLESEPADFVTDDVNIDIHAIAPIPRNGLPFIAFAAKKILLQSWQLLSLCFEVRESDYILIQNPPSLPIVAIVAVFIRLFARHTKLVIDWHNLNWSVLNLRFDNERHPLVRAMKAYEHYVVARLADYHLVVTKAMKKTICKEFGVVPSTVYVVYDRPPQHLAPLEDPASERESLFARYDITAPKDAKMVLSSTSFTPDEDFNVLLDALERMAPTCPPLVVVITGKGPMKAQFLERVKELAFDPARVVVVSVWLSVEDYPRMVGCADVGVSLHTSSSGVDLPMKILDMFGCGVPAVSLDFPAIGELVHDKANGLVTSPKDLDKALTAALTDDALYKTIKEGAMAESASKWDANWKKSVLSLFNYE